MNTFKENFSHLFDDDQLTLREALLELDKATASNSLEEFPHELQVKCLWDLINQIDKKALDTPLY